MRLQTLCYGSVYDLVVVRNVQAHRRPTQPSGKQTCTNFTRHSTLTLLPISSRQYPALYVKSCSLQAKDPAYFPLLPQQDRGSSITPQHPPQGLASERCALHTDQSQQLSAPSLRRRAGREAAVLAMLTMSQNRQRHWSMLVFCTPCAYGLHMASFCPSAPMPQANKQGPWLFSAVTVTSIRTSPSCAAGVFWLHRKHCLHRQLSNAGLPKVCQLRARRAHMPRKQKLVGAPLAVQAARRPAPAHRHPATHVHKERIGTRCAACSHAVQAQRCNPG